MKNFSEFWPFYLSQHSNRVCQILHFVGTTLALLIMVFSGLSGHPVWILGGLGVGYTFAWIGHFGFEKNRPATFKYPFWSFAADLKMNYIMWVQLFKKLAK